MIRIPPATDQLEIADVAELLGRSTDDVRRILRRGDLRGWKTVTGRWWTTREHVAAFLGLAPADQAGGGTRPAQPAEDMAEALR